MIQKKGERGQRKGSGIRYGCEIRNETRTQAGITRVCVTRSVGGATGPRGRMWNKVSDLRYTCPCHPGAMELHQLSFPGKSIKAGSAAAHENASP